MKRTLITLFIFLPVATFAYTFPRTLTVGMSGDDVKNLQIILNSDPVTAIASTGPGSNGQESTYFGALTEAALEKFQQKYAPEVLFPAGIYKPTGVAGSYTRAKLEGISSNTNFSSIGRITSVLPADTAMIIPPTSSIQAPQTYYSSQYLASVDFYKKYSSGSVPLFLTISKYSVRHGDSVTITGSGFLEANTIYFGQNYHIDNISRIDSNTLTFVVPESVPNGSYAVWVVNKNGSTYKPNASNFFTISDSPADPPTISDFYPKTVSPTQGAIITISGSGFSATGNNVYSELGTIVNVNSDGHILTFPLSSFSGYLQFVKNLKVVPTTPIIIMISNRNGSASIPTPILLQ